VKNPIKHRFSIFLAACAAFLLGLPSALAQIKVACVGDSITAGMGLANAGTQSYPAQLQLLLGGGYMVGNFGLSGATLLKQSDFTYWNTSQHTGSLAYSPNIVVIMLGTNDTKSWNWNATNFAADYNDLIAQYQALPTQPKVYICLSPSVFTPNAFGTTFDPAFVQNTLVPAIRSVATSNGVRLIDNNTPLLNHPELFSDGVHPTAQGAGVIAATVAEAFAVALPKHRLQSTGSAAPTPGAGDISQLATSNTTWPDGLNYFTDNNPIAGQTFTTGSSPMNLVSLSVKTAGLNSGNGYGTPASTPTYYLRIYAINGSTATHLITFSSPNPGYTDGDWLKWTGMKVPLDANKTYAFSFGTKPGNGGWAAVAVAANAYAGGEIAMIPVNGGTITTGASHSFDAAFALDLEEFPPGIPANMPLPMPTYGFNLGNTFEATWGYPPPTQAVLISAANAGFNAVRMPCAWDFNADDTTWQIDPAYMAQVKQAVDWAIAAGLHVKLNVHWDGGWMENNIGETVDPVINAKLQSYWTQIATTFAGYDNRLLFAAANEPNVHNLAEFNTLVAYYQTFINTVRGLGGNNANRWLVLQGGGDTAWFTTLPPDPTPGRLMVEYHCYTPSQFAILSEDATWGIAQYYWGPAYHYAGDPTRNCVAPEEGFIDSGFQQLKEQYVDKGIPVLIGEFGVGAKPTTGEAAAYSRASSLYWLKYVVDSAHAHGLSPFNWSTPNSPFEYATGAITNPDVVSVLTGGIAPPPPNGAPFAASGLTATTVGTGQVNLSWTAGSGATSYNLYRSAQSGYGSAIAPVVTGITGTSYSDTGLNDGTTYYYQVVAVNSSGPSGFSPEAHATTPGVNPDPTKYHFETDTHRWSFSGAQISGIATSNTRAFAGSRSLAVNFNGATGGTSSIQVGDVNVPAGETISFRVWIPAGSPVNLIEPYAQDYNWGWTASWFGNPAANTWNTINVTVPSNATAPLKQLGLRISTNAAWTGTVYVDSINWNTLSQPAAPTSLTAVEGSGKVTLNWSANAMAATYNVKRSTTSGSGYATIGTTASPTFIDAGVVNGTTYYYVVSAANAAGEGANSAEASALPTEMRAHYTFEGNAQDASGNAFHGTPTAVTYATGQIGSQAGQFNGTSGTVSIPRSVTDDFTVMMWVKTTDYGGWSGAHWWAGKGLVDGEVGGGGADWGTALVDGKFVLGVGATGGDTTLTSAVNINDGGWHHVAATRNTTTGAMAVYVDGVPSGTGTGPTGSRTFPPGLRIGSLQTGNNFLNGAIDDVRLYDRVLTGSEIAAFVNTPPILESISDSTVNVGQTVAFTASGTDNDLPAQTMSYTLLTGPANATLDSNSGAFSFRPLVTQANTTIPFTLQVSDNGVPPLTATRSFSVTVNPLVMPTLGNVTFAGGLLSLHVNGQAGPDYRIETSINLSHWTPLHTATSPAMPFTWTDTDTSGSTQRFYRVKVGPPLDEE
jgi:lysophospholipase L1-like esterase/fibronectin type 3 domain-containing protein